MGQFNIKRPRYDYLGQKLKIGDTVVIINPWYREFTKAKILTFTAKQVRLKMINHGLDETLRSEDRLILDTSKNNKNT